MKDFDNASDATKEGGAGSDQRLNPIGQRAIQGDDPPSPAAPETPSDELPPDFQPATASTELGDARRAETEAEKTEVKHYHNNSPEGIYGEGRGGRG